MVGKTQCFNFGIYVATKILVTTIDNSSRSCILSMKVNKQGSRKFWW
ncbi:hypothetical protein FACS1894164_19330 [Spirochaetia bacterium]|nr:hypothetical protein FACS1894164_19330 [Spirochaetia bacterium]